VLSRDSSPSTRGVSRNRSGSCSDEPTPADERASECGAVARRAAARCCSDGGDAMEAALDEPTAETPPTEGERPPCWSGLWLWRWLLPAVRVWERHEPLPLDDGVADDMVVVRESKTKNPVNTKAEERGIQSKSFQLDGIPSLPGERSDREGGSREVALSLSRAEEETGDAVEKVAVQTERSVLESIRRTNTRA
jgi:hypothetical protein